MPFTPYQSAFNAEALQEAFDMAWSKVGHSPGVMLDQEKARSIIAQRIVYAWRQQGERDPELLKAYAVQGLTD